MPRKILIIGASGMLGASLFRYLSKQVDLKVFGTVRSQQSIELLGETSNSNIESGIDVLCFEELQRVVEQFRPDYLLNCVGIIKQLDSSKSPVPTIELNSLLPHKLAHLSSRFGARLIHFSTDCVFSGFKGNYFEDDLPDSTDLYGRSKLLGEVDYGPHLTLRTSIIGHEIGKSVSLVDWYLSQENSVRGYRKAIFSGLPAVYVAEFLYRYVFGSDLSGLHHLSVDPIDKFSLLTLIKEIYGLGAEIDPYDDFEINRSLNSETLREAAGFNPENWHTLVGKMREEYIEYFADR